MTTLPLPDVIDVLAFDRGLRRLYAASEPLWSPCSWLPPIARYPKPGAAYSPQTLTASWSEMFIAAVGAMRYALCACADNVLVVFAVLDGSADPAPRSGAGLRSREQAVMSLL